MRLSLLLALLGESLLLRHHVRRVCAERLAVQLLLKNLLLLCLLLLELVRLELSLVLHLALVDLVLRGVDHRSQLGGRRSAVEAGADLALELRGLLLSRDRVDLVEVRVLERLASRDTLGRLVDEHLGDEVERLRIGAAELLHRLRQRLLGPLREGRLVVGERADTGPRLLSRRTQLTEDAKQLIDLGVAREERLLGDHLDEDARDRPDVDRSRVLATAEENLGSAVPESDDLVGEGANRQAERAGQTEVGQLQGALAIDQQVLRLQVLESR